MQTNATHTKTRKTTRPGLSTPQAKPRDDKRREWQRTDKRARWS